MLQVRELEHCGQCEKQLEPDGPSLYWCSQVCQAVWQAAQAGVELSPDQLFLLARSQSDAW